MATDEGPPTPPADLGYELRWRDRLSSRLLFFTTVAGLVIVAAFFVAELRFERFVVQQAAEESDLVAQTVANAIHRAMLLDRREDAYRILEDVGRQPGVDRIRLLDHGGRVAFSTDSSETGRTLDPRGPQCVVCHSAGAGRAAGLEGRRSIEMIGGQRVLQLVAPIPNQPACAAGGCHVHPSAARLLGVLAVDRSLAPADARLANFRWSSLGVAAVVAAGLGLAFWWVTRRQLVQPVAALVAATRRVAHLDLEQPAAPGFGGELGLLAANFGEMVRSLRAARAELDALNQDLEKKVDARTRSLVEAREQLARGETLAALGRLSAAVGHRLGSPLSGILTVARNAARSLEAGPLPDQERARLVHDLRLVEREAERAGEVVIRLLDFSREHPFSAQPLGIDSVVAEVLELAANEARLQGIDRGPAHHPDAAGARRPGADPAGGARHPAARVQHHAWRRPAHRRDRPCGGRARGRDRGHRLGAGAPAGAAGARLRARLLGHRRRRARAGPGPHHRGPARRPAGGLQRAGRGTRVAIRLPGAALGRRGRGAVTWPWSPSPSAGSGSARWPQR